MFSLTRQRTPRLLFDRSAVYVAARGFRLDPSTPYFTSNIPMTAPASTSPSAVLFSSSSFASATPSTASSTSSSTSSSSSTAASPAAEAAAAETSVAAEEAAPAAASAQGSGEKGEPAAEGASEGPSSRKLGLISLFILGTSAVAYAGVLKAQRETFSLYKMLHKVDAPRSRDAAMAPSPALNDKEAAVVRILGDSQAYSGSPKLKALASSVFDAHSVVRATSGPSNQVVITPIKEFAEKANSDFFWLQLAAARKPVIQQELEVIKQEEKRTKDFVRSSRLSLFVDETLCRFADRRRELTKELKMLEKKEQDILKKREKERQEEARREKKRADEEEKERKKQLKQ